MVVLSVAPAQPGPFGPRIIGNVISGSTPSPFTGDTGEGISLSASEAFILGNWIGTDASGTNPLGNAGPGVSIFSGPGSTVGGVNTGDGNVIAFNGGAGVEVVGNFTTNNAILSNSIFSNKIGIDLGGNGVTPNTPGGPHAGPNTLQNTPVIASATTDGSTVNVAGVLNSTPSSAFMVQFFADNGDASGLAEGRVFLGQRAVTTDASGNASFNFTLAFSGITSVSAITATATDSNGNTSEFSLDTVVRSKGDSGFGSLRQAILNANAIGNVPATINFNILSRGGAIQLIPSTALPTITSPVFIDGYSQPGSKPNDLGFGDNAQLIVILEGNNAGANANGLTIAADSVTIRGLSITGFQQNAIVADDHRNLRISGNFLGVLPFPFASQSNDNHQSGIAFHGVTNSTIGGPAAADRNVISGNQGYGVFLGPGSLSPANGSDFNLIANNNIGTPINASKGNSLSGILLSSSSNNTIGGTAFAARNVIGGNLLDGIAVRGPAATGNLILTNAIGFDGFSAISNGGDAISIVDALMTTGDFAATIGGNVLSANSGGGIRLTHSRVLVQGNRIGTDVGGQSAAGNASFGILLSNDQGSLIGGTSADLANTIANNGQGRLGDGGIVELGTPAATFRENLIFANTPLGIDLGGDGVTPNKPPTSINDPNRFPNYPVVARAITDGQLTHVSGSFDGTESVLTFVDFFVSTAADRSGFGQGQSYLGSVSFTTDDNGHADFLFDVPALPLGRVITTTATSFATSEFSRAVTVTAGTAVPQLSLTIDASPDPVAVGDLLTYVVTTTNDGTGDATNIVLADTLPGGVAITDESALAIRAQGGSIGTNSSGRVVVSLPFDLITVGSMRTLTIQARPSHSGDLVNDASVTYAVAGSPVVQTSSIISQATATPLLTLSMTATPEPVPVADLLTYTIVVRNVGTADAKGVNLFDLLPQVVTITQESTDAIFAMGGSVFPTGSFQTGIQLGFGTLAAGASRTLVFQVRLTSETTFTNTASVSNSPGSTSALASATSHSIYTFTVLNNNDSGFGSIRQAILNANTHPGVDTIDFKLPSDQLAIRPISLLPTITDPTILDATTQPGFAGSPIVELNGSKLASSPTAPVFAGLTVTAPGTTIRGLIIDGWVTNGIALLGGSGSKVVGSSIHDNGDSGIYVSRSSNNTIGGTTAADRDVISGNAFVGVQIIDGSSHNQILGSYIGVDASGSRPFGNGLDGVILADSPDNTIGGTAPGAGNVISANGEANVQVYSGGSMGNAIVGNLIGTDSTGQHGFSQSATASRGETNVGIFLNAASRNTIAGNVISGAEAGVEVYTSSATSNLIINNRIGTDLLGTRAVPNSIGVLLYGSPGNTVGGFVGGQGNVISGNALANVRIEGQTASRNLIAGNLIGLDISGMTVLDSAIDGLFLSNSPGNTIGGVIPGAGNVIAGYQSVGIQILGTPASNNLVVGNLIGTTSAGVKAGSGLDGIVVTDSSGTTIGGTASGSGNIVVGNQDAGIAIIGNAATANVVQGNTLRGNGVNGIEAEHPESNTITTAGPGVNNVNGSLGGVQTASRLGPHVLSLVTRGSGSSVVLSFSSPLDPGHAGDTRGYRVDVLNARGRRVGIATIHSAVYDDRAMTVVLTFASPRPISGSYRVVVLGHGKHAITDTVGHRLAGNSRGKSGTDYTGHFGAARAAVSSHPNGPAFHFHRRALGT
ncbi:MAG: hypothetical protein JWN86_4020 [Planctomycetota bacterium]|nr:hypothetical protein [Planctomycetota bacterium]